MFPYRQRTPEELDGLRADEIDFDEIEVEPNVFMECKVRADFVYDGLDWHADCVWLRTTHRARDGFTYQHLDKWTIANAETGFQGVVDAVEKWANRNLIPEDYL